MNNMKNLFEGFDESPGLKIHLKSLIAKFKKY